MAGQTKVSHFFATLLMRQPLHAGRLSLSVVASSAAAALLELTATAAGAGLVGAHGRSPGTGGRDERTA